MNRLQSARNAVLIAISLCTFGIGGALAESPATVSGAAEPAAVSTPDSEVAAVYTAVQTAAAAAADQAALTAEVTKILEGFVDYPTFAKRTLKSTWPDLDTAQRERFMTSFKALIIQTYAKRFSPKAKFEWKHRGETQLKGETKNLAKVRTTVSTDKISVNVDYVMLRLGDEKTPAWKAYDFEVDDVSWARNWRRQFDQVIKKDGYETLISKIEAQVEK